MRRVYLSLVAVWVSGSSPVWSQPKRPKLPPPKPETPAALPKEQLVAWKKAGFAAGWVRLGQYPFDFRNGEGYPGDIPAFAVEKLDVTAFAKLPEPDQPFGMFFGETRLAEAEMKILAGFRNLHLLQSHSPTTEAALKHLGAMANLEMVQLRTATPGDVAVLALQGLKKLRSLHVYGNTPITEVGMKVIAGLVNLNDLGLDFNGSATEMKYLASLKKLWRLDIGSAKVTDEGLQEIAGLRHLDYLNLNSAVLTDVGLKHLARFELLQELHLGNQRSITDTGLKELAALKELRELDLMNSSVNGTGLEALAELKHLQVLSLNGARITDEGLKGVAKVKVLHTLFLSGTKITDAGMGELAALPNLQQLYVGSPKITDAGVRQLAGCEKLSGLNLFGSSVTDESLNVLAAFPRLTSVDLRQTKVTAEGVLAMKKLRPKLNLDR